jgi:hypothetical protein
VWPSAIADNKRDTLFIDMSRGWLSRIASKRVDDVSRRRSRWRPWFLLVAVSVGWKLLVLTLGAAIPHWIIDDGLDHIPASMQPYASQARATALALWDRPIERTGLVQLVRVVSVDSTRGTNADACGGMSARVRAYTFFAIPYSEVRTVCDRGVVEYRVFRRRR